MNAEDFQEKMLGHGRVRAEFELGAIERDRPDQAPYGGLGAQMMADEDDFAGPVDRKFLVDFVLWDCLFSRRV